MIPLRIRLHHFLSYQSAVLDLTGIHTACISGANGAGKSSLLEALTWGIWGQSRADNDDHLVRKGSTETQVEIIYQSQEQVYRILRSKMLAGSSSLEWQIQTAHGWRSLTSKGIRSTQQAIQAQLKLDYETFINSAYLRQGRADEFTVKRPGERKQILAEILKLGQYEHLAEKCREKARLSKIQLDLRQETLDALPTQAMADLDYQREQLLQEQRDLEGLQQQAQQDLRTLQEALDHYRILKNRHQDLTEHLDRLTRTLQSTELQWRQQQQQQQDLEVLFAQETRIREGCRQYETWLEKDQLLNEHFQHYQWLQQEQHRIQSELAEKNTEFTQHYQEYPIHRQRIQNQLHLLDIQQQADEQIIKDRKRIELALETYRQASRHLKDWESRQAKTALLRSQYQTYQASLQEERSQMMARCQFLKEEIQRLQQQHEQLPQIQNAVMTIEQELIQLDNQRKYQQWLLEKRQERQLFMQQLQERQRVLQKQWQILEEKHQLLRGLDPHCYFSSDPYSLSIAKGSSLETDPSLALSLSEDLVRSFEPDLHSSSQLTLQLENCPLCDRPLSPELRTLVLDKHRLEQEDIASELFVIREQLAVADREIQVMREEYEELSSQLQAIDIQRQTQGRLQHQLETTYLQLNQQQVWEKELKQLQESLDNNQFAAEIQKTLTQLEIEIETIAYSEKDHSLCRSEVERWRWAESRWAEWQKARQREHTLTEKRTLLEKELHHAEEVYQGILHQNQEATTPLKQQLKSIELELQQWAYDANYHQQVRQELQQTQGWLNQWQALLQAQQALPLCRERSTTLLNHLHQQRQEFTQSTRQLEDLRKRLVEQEALLPPEGRIQELTQRLQDQRHAMDQAISRSGALQQQRQHQAEIDQQRIQLQQQVQGIRRQYQVFQEVAAAYGRNGIPALIIENVLPELETEANQILSRLTSHQLHLRFVTQRSGRRSSRMIDTLDILIADPQGTRPYETYSGGEAFRINFSIRLALSRLLAQRVGARLQTLLIDEGFGTQDQTGRQQLVAAINAVAPDFACILVITHIASLRDAFPHRIQVERSLETGSHLHILS